MLLLNYLQPCSLFKRKKVTRKGMADDIDDLLDEVESKFCGKNINSQAKTSKTLHPSSSTK